MNREIRRLIMKAAGDTITTGTLTSGLLNPEQSKKFLKQTMEATVLAPLVRHEIRRSRTGEIDKIGIGRRIIRRKTENTDDGYRATVKTSQIEYSCHPVRLPWEISEETLRENIEDANFEQTVTDLMTKQVGVDNEDLWLNGDESTVTAAAFSATDAYSVGDYCTKDGNLYTCTAAHAAGAWNADHFKAVTADADVDFLKLDDGWIKQISNGGHVYDASGESSMNLDIFYKALAQVPNKYNDGSLRWLMSPRRRQEWELFLLNKVINAGGVVPEALYKSPASIPVIECPALADDKILLTNPKNLVVVNTYDVKIRKAAEGKSAIMQDKRFYVVHYDLDCIIEELDATGIITGLKVA